jgi:hypothetical protein
MVLVQIPQKKALDSKVETILYSDGGFEVACETSCKSKHEKPAEFVDQIS